MSSLSFYTSNKIVIIVARIRITVPFVTSNSIPGANLWGSESVVCVTVILTRSHKPKAIDICTKILVLSSLICSHEQFFRSSRRPCRCMALTFYCYSKLNRQARTRYREPYYHRNLIRRLRFTQTLVGYLQTFNLHNY